MEKGKLYVIRQIVEKGFGEADFDIIDEFITDDWKEHQNNLKGGKKVLKNAILNIALAFSDRKYSLLQSCENGDMVWAHYEFSGIHTGPFMGYPATHKKIIIDVIDIARIMNGRLVEHWGIPDRFALLKQIS